MKRNTRQDILNTAKALLNQKGFNAVSMGDIAAELGISKGNVTYYFKKKEYIVRALLLEMTDRVPLAAPRDLTGLDAFFADIQTVARENSFYFLHHTQIAQLLPEIKEKQYDIYQANAEKLGITFQSLREDGLLAAEANEGEYARVIDTLLLSAIYWVPFCELRAPDNTQGSFSRQAWSILFPLLTEKGRHSAKGFEG